VAEGIPRRVEVEAPEPVRLGDGVQAARRYPGFALHPFPNCFVCGPKRAEGDGLRIFAGPVTGRKVVAAPWTPDETLAGSDGLVRLEFLWAALDCPGAFANGFPAVPMVLGRLAARVLRPAHPGDKSVVVGWSEGVEGRKHIAGTALFGVDGELRAVARATWIRAKNQRFPSRDVTGTHLWLISVPGWLRRSESTAGRPSGGSRPA